MEMSLLKTQHDFITTDSKYTLMLGGIGSAKTFAGAHFAIRMAIEYPDAKGMIVANTYTQLINATVETLTQELDKLNIKYQKILGGSTKYIKIGETRILLYSLDAYQNIRGPEVGWIWADECAFAKREAFDVVIGRLRDKRGPLLFRGTTSPNGFNWCYDIFGNFGGERASETYKLIKARTRDNLFLPDGYYETLLELYGGIENPLAKQELEGEFVNLQAGAIYWGFDRDRNVAECKPHESRLIYLGQDFNVDPMCGVAVEYANNTFYVYRENVLHDSNTYELAEFLPQYFPRHRTKIIPDSTGNSRKTSSTKTDLQILREAGYTVDYTHNPLIRDRQNNLNMLMKQGRVKIDPSCKNLIKELETLSHRDKEGDVSHVAVALGYVTWKLRPLSKPQSPNRTINF